MSRLVETSDYELTPPREPWRDAGLTCPTGDPTHQPHPDPWWSGDSVFAEHPDYRAQQVRSPHGAEFFHVVYHAGPKLRAGDRLLSPAARREPSPRFTNAFCEDGCIEYKHYDVHGVYVTTERRDSEASVIYRVKPEGRMWVDPERIGVSRVDGPVDWCCDSALILEVIPS